MEIDLIKENGLLAMINMHSWMFLKSFQNLRINLFENKTILNMIHLGTRAFNEISGDVVQTTSFIIKNNKLDYEATYFKLTDILNKEKLFIKNKTIKNPKIVYLRNLKRIRCIPGNIFGYWANDKVIEIFKNSPAISEFADSRQGLATTNNNKYLRLWYELVLGDINFNSKNKVEAMNSMKKWFPYNKGGAYRKWYGNYDYVVNYMNDGEEIKKDVLQKYPYLKTPEFVVKNSEFYFRKSITWPLIQSKGFNSRFRLEGSIHDVSGMSTFSDDEENLYYLMGILNTVSANEIFKILNPTINLQVGDFEVFPIVIVGDDDKSKIINNVKINVQLAKDDWDSFETSWDFLRHPLVKGNNLLNLWNEYDKLTKTNFNQLKSNEEELNEYFINLYGLEDELTKEVEDKYVTISLADKERDVRSLISYLIGVLMGRYSLVEEGLIYAGGEFDNTRYGNFELDSDGIIPIYSKLGMEDNLTNKIIKLIKQIYGDDTYKENIDFIAESLGKRQNETSEETLNRYLNNDFYNDHIKIYQKRPIYWMFSSGKDNGFKVLVYLHRYSENTLAMINSNYLLPETTRLRNELNDIDISIKAADNVTQRRLEREKDLINKQYHEAVEYGYVLDHMANRYIKLDLDDGVKVNYMKFQGIEVVSDSGTKIKKDLLVPFKL